MPPTRDKGGQRTVVPITVSHMKSQRKEEAPGWKYVEMMTDMVTYRGVFGNSKCLMEGGGQANPQWGLIAGGEGRGKE